MKTPFYGKSYHREADGHTYYFRNRVLVGHPTNADGSCDFDPDVEIAVEDFSAPLLDEEVVEITGVLNARIRYQRELDRFIDAAYRLSAAWHEDDVENYPSYLPSFDQFVSDVREMSKTTCRTIQAKE